MLQEGTGDKSSTGHSGHVFQHMILVRSKFAYFNSLSGLKLNISSCSFFPVLDARADTTV